MSGEFHYPNDSEKEIVEHLMRAFLCSIKSPLDASSCYYNHRILDELLFQFEAAIETSQSDYCDCEESYSLEWDHSTPTWAEFNERLHVELCELVLSGLRNLIREVLPGMKLSEDVLNYWRENLPILFADTAP
jgi:hypothetical protein